MRAALYARVSTEDQAEKYGLSSQLTELRELAAKKSFTVPEGAEFVDDGYSGATLDRPALDRLREAVRARAFDVVLVHDPDRLSRKLAHQLLLVEELERAGVGLEYFTTPREDTPEGRLLLNVKGVVAEYEREKIRERTTRGKKQKARSKLVPTGPWPYGYRLDPTQPGGLGIHDDEARVVREMFRWLAEGTSVRGVVARLNRLPVIPKARRAKLWGKSSVRRILTSETYVGRYWYNRREKATDGRMKLRDESEWFAIDVPPIVDRATFERVRQQLDRNQQMIKGRPPTRVYLLRGLLYCGDCGRRMHGIPTHGRRFYRCSGRDRLKGDARCLAVTVNAERVERVVWETIERGLKDPRLLMGKLQEHRTVARRGLEVRTEVAQLEADLARVRAVDGPGTVRLAGMGVGRLVSQSASGRASRISVGKFGG